MSYKRKIPWVRQPQYPTPIDKANPLTKGLVADFSVSGTSVLYNSVANVFPTSDNGLYRLNEQGVSRYYSGGQQAVFPNRPEYKLTGAMTVIVIVDVDALTSYGALISCWDTTTTNGWELRLGEGSTDSKILWHRANTSEKQFRASATSLITAGTKNNFIAVMCSSGLVETAPTYNINGVSYSGVSSSGVATGAQTGAVDPLYIATREDGVTKLDGAISAILLFDRALSFDETERIRLSPNQRFNGLMRNIYVEASAGGGITGTLAATESGADTSAFAGDVYISGTIGANESGADTAAFAGDVYVSGSLSTTESGSDTSSFAGDVYISGTLSSNESGSDTASFSGTAAGPITGTLAATEIGQDTSSFRGPTSESSANSGGYWYQGPEPLYRRIKDLDEQEAEVIVSLAKIQSSDLKQTEKDRNEQLRQELKLKNIEVELRHIQALNQERQILIDAEIASLMKFAQIEAENEQYLELVLLAAAA